MNAEREAIESRIPDQLLYEKGWPKVIPTYEEAELLAGIRRQVAALTGIEPKYLDAASITERYKALIEERQAKSK